MSIRGRVFILLCVTVGVFIGVFSFPRIGQDPHYHLFADNRTFFGIPNFFDVVSNVFFLIAGLWGLMHISRHGTAFREKLEQWPYIIFFLGFALTCFGSGYYHLLPENSTLLWDRLAMAVVCVGILAGTMNDRIGHRAGTVSLVPLMLFGIFSVAYWYISELSGSGDMRFYAIEQFYSLAAIVLLMLLFPARYTHSGWLAAGCGAYALAKILETLDRQVFSLMCISGHTLKHLASSLAALCILQMLRRRKPAETADKESSNTQGL